MPTKAELLASIKSEIAKARELHDSGRELTDSEYATVQQHLDAAKSAHQQVKRLNGDQAIRTVISDLSSTATDTAPAWATKGKAGRSDWSKSTADRIVTANTDRTGRKSIVSGQYEVQSVLQGGIDQLPEYPARLIDLLVNRKALATGNQYDYLQQTVRNHAAAVVADTEEKPTSVYTFAEREDRVRVVAHLSEPIPNRLASDIDGLTEFLTSEMEEGLIRAVEQEVLSGDGTGEHMTGLLNTSGLIEQEWSADLFSTMRKASTALEVQGEAPTAWAVHPSDVEVLDLLSDGQERMYFGGPEQQLGQSAPVWSIPVVKSVSVPPGTAILGDWSRLLLVVREDAQLDIDTSGELFRTNQFQARMEGRYGNAVLRPSAFCRVATQAAA